MGDTTNLNSSGDGDAAIQEIQHLISRDEEQILFSLGVGYTHYGAPEGTCFRADYLDMGTKLWKSIRYELRSALCISGEPKEWVGELIAGDGRDLAIGILTALVSALSIPLAIAVPATALVLKRGIATLCSEPPGVQPSEGARELLDQRAAQMKGLEDELR